MPSSPSTVLATFPNPAVDRDFTIRMTLPEFTCLCPMTGQPDFATLELEYVPDLSCVELRSLKQYIWSFRDRGAFHEAVTNEIAGHIAARYELGGKRLLVSWPLAALAAALGLGVCLISHFRSPHAVVYACSVSVQFLAPCPLAKPDYLMRVYGATLLTLGIMQCAPVRTFLQHKWLSALGRLSFPIYLTHWPIIFGLGSFSLVMLAPFAGAPAARLLAMLISIVATILAAKCFEPVDQIALRVSRASRKQKVTEAGAPGPARP